MKVDYIIVGLGLAGLAFVEELIKANKTFVVYEDHSQTSSLVAGGVYNPVILKRFTPVWNAKEQLEVALPFYKDLEDRFEIELDYKFSTRKVFKSIEDQNNWFIASDKPQLSEFMNPSIFTEKKAGIIGEHGYGEVYQTGRIDTHKLVESYREFLTQQQRIRFERFEHAELNLSDSQIEYKGVLSEHIVFSEGYGLKENIFFNYLPLNEAKGELITIHAPKLNIDFLVKSTLFVLPLGNDQYKVGATFNWKDKTSLPTEDGKSELIEKLNKVLDTPYEIIDHTAGVRPTVKDRRPLVGRHPKHSQMFILNGLGTRGVMIAPTVAKELFQHIEMNSSLDPEINIERYRKEYDQ